MKNLIFVILLLISVSCKQDTQYAYYDNTPAIEKDDRIYPLSLLETDKNVDVLMIIDNSGSMSTIQQNVILNSRTFLDQFAKQPYINWKIGLISTDKADNPYLGFDIPFDWNLIDHRDPTSFDRTVSTFQNAVAQLGTLGDGYEYIFYNIKRVIDLFDGKTPNHPAFLRPNSHLVVIMVTDEMEQSESSYGKPYNAPNFAKTMAQYIPGNKILRFYGALNRKDLAGCNLPGDSEPYAGSPYETIINLTRGFNISACLSNFGTELAKIGKDIVSLVGLPSLLLKQRPVASTLKVYYKDKLLKPGAKEDGGIWFYEEDTNTINFYTMEFVQDPRNDYFKIDFDIDDGNH